MDEIEGKVIVEGNLPKEMNYEKISNVEDYDGSRCVVVNTLDPDLFLIFGKIDCIISKRGSKLSHLAILAREYGKSIILAENEKIGDKGELSIAREGDTAIMKLKS